MPRPPEDLLHFNRAVRYTRAKEKKASEVLPIRCPRCDSSKLRSSYSLSLFERLAKTIGFFQFRCRDCDHRFTESIWDARNLLYARCPLCYRVDLALWKPEQYHSPFTWRLLLGLGAKPRRCEACRKNFVSFRPCKAVYTKRKFVRAATAADAVQTDTGSD